jgi:hypothetical protein
VHRCRLPIKYSHGVTRVAEVALRRFRASQLVSSPITVWQRVLDDFIFPYVNKG